MLLNVIELRDVKTAHDTARIVDDLNPDGLRELDWALETNLIRLHFWA
jgi:hypothetical protein